jgi:hypothetical protein
MRPVPGLLVVMAIATVSGGRQAAAQDALLRSRLDHSTYLTVRVIIDSAATTGLPARPIEDKALEGASAGAEGHEIVSALRTYVRQMAAASMALGRDASIDELRAAVGVIDAGVPGRDLARIRGAAGDRSIAMALTVIGDIVVRGVPVASSTNLVISLLRAQVKDAELLDFDRAVRLDIGNGADPSTAAAARAKGAILRFGISKPPRTAR